MAGGKLKKVDIAGGPPTDDLRRANGADGSWSQEGVILFDGRSADPLWRVPAAGGVRQPLVFGEDKEPRARSAPAGRSSCPTASTSSSRWATRTEMTLTVGSLDSKETKPLFKTTSTVQYAEPGYLLFVRERTLVAQKFDVGSLSVEGEPVPIGRGPWLRRPGPGLVLGLAQRRAGLPGGRADRHAAGVAGSQRARRRPFSTHRPTIATRRCRPTARELTYDVADSGSTRGDIWIRDLARGVSSRFTFDATADDGPAMVARRAPDCLHVARQGCRRPVRQGRVRHAGGRTAAGVCRREVRLGLVARRPLHPVHDPGAERQVVGHLGAAARRRQEADRDRQHEVRTSCGPLSRPTASTSPTSRTSQVGRDLRPRVPRGAEQVAGLDRGRHRAVLARRRSRVVLPGGNQPDGGSGAGRPPPSPSARPCVCSRRDLPRSPCAGTIGRPRTASGSSCSRRWRATRSSRRRWC